MSFEKSLSKVEIKSNFFFSESNKTAESGSNWMFSIEIVNPLEPSLMFTFFKFKSSTVFWSFSTFFLLLENFAWVISAFEIPLKSTMLLYISDILIWNSSS